MSSKVRPFPLKATLGIAAFTVAAIGAISGQAIGSTPMLMTDTTAAVANTSDERESFAAIAGEDRPPDHYDLVTPDGTIPVAELALHGRLRGKDDGWWDSAEPVMLDASYEDEFSGQEIERLATAEPAPSSPQEEDEDATAHPTKAGASDGTVRIVDVSAAVAAAGQY